MGMFLFVVESSNTQAALHGELRRLGARWASVHASGEVRMNEHVLNLATELDRDADAHASSLFVINLCASMTPVTVDRQGLPGFEHYKVYQVSRLEDGRRRYRLRLGFFSDESSAADVLASVRSSYATAFITALCDEDIKHASAYLNRPAQQVQEEVDLQRSGKYKVLRMDVHEKQRLMNAESTRASRDNDTTGSFDLAPEAAAPQSPLAARAAALKARIARAKEAAGAGTARPAIPTIEPVADSGALSARSAADNAPVVTDQIEVDLASIAKEIADEFSGKPAIKTPAPKPTVAKPPALTAPQPKTPAAKPAAKAAVPAVIARGEAQSRQDRRPLDSTETVRALTQAELEDETAPKWFAVQMALSDQPLNLDALPHMDIFDAYSMYSVAIMTDGRIRYALRLGFFSEAVSADAVTSYLKTFFNATTVLRVSAAEHERFSGKTGAGDSKRAQRNRQSNEIVLEEKNALSFGSESTPANKAAGAPVADAMANKKSGSLISRLVGKLAK